MRKYLWYAITNLGTLSVLLPYVLLIAFVLLVTTSTRRPSLVWLTSVVVGETIVATTKILYMGWRLGIASLDFIGLSGHTTLSLIVWPVALSLFLGQTDAWRAAGVTSGSYSLPQQRSHGSKSIPTQSLKLFWAGFSALLYLVHFLFVTAGVFIWSCCLDGLP